MATQQWYALKVRDGFEILVAQRLTKLNLEIFVPDLKFVKHPQQPRQRGAGYLYSCFDSDDRKSIASIPGVLAVLGTSDPAFKSEPYRLQPKGRFSLKQ